MDRATRVCLRWMNNLLGGHLVARLDVGEYFIVISYKYIIIGVKTAGAYQPQFASDLNCKHNNKLDRNLVH